jgi:hypothetical protein
MDNKNLNLDLETLKEIKFACNLYSDMSSRTLGYDWLCKRIEELEKLKKSEESETNNDNTLSKEAKHLLECFLNVTRVIETNNPDFDNAIKIKIYNAAQSTLVHCILIRNNKLATEIENYIKKLSLPREVKTTFTPSYNIQSDTDYHMICARATLFPDKSLEEVKEILAAKKYNLLLKQLDEWIYECSVQAEMFRSDNLEIASFGSDAMMQAYTIVKNYINKL